MENENTLPPWRRLDRFTPKQASEYLERRWGLHYTVPTLATYRTRGGGPPYQKPDKSGRVHYERVDLDTWAQHKLGSKWKSTSEKLTDLEMTT